MLSTLRTRNIDCSVGSN